MADLLQFKVGTSATITQTFIVDGLPLDLDAGVPTVTITRPDGTTISSGTVSAAWTGRTTGQYRFVLAAQPEVTVLTVTWTGTIGDQVQTLTDTIEIVGADLFTLPAFRQLKVANGYPFAADAIPPFTDAQIRDARTEALEEMHAILGFPPVPRFARETHSATGAAAVPLYQAKPLELLSVSVAGTAQTVGNYYLDRAAVVVRPVSSYAAGPAIPSGVGNVTVEYSHGWERPRGECGHAAQLWVAQNLNPSGFENANTVTTADGVAYTYEPSEVGRDRYQRFTGVRKLDRWLNRHRTLAVA